MKKSIPQNITRCPKCQTLHIVYSHQLHGWTCLEANCRTLVPDRAYYRKMRRRRPGKLELARRWDANKSRRQG
ncbi:MAG: hypothetical protein AB1690_02565 [Candidatus Zixiibacteriota bacterium]